MNKVFKAEKFFTVPDGTEVSAFLNAADTTQKDVPWGMLNEVTIAAGRIKPGVFSAVHILPVVMQVTYCVAGKLEVRMQGLPEKESYDIEIGPGEAIVTPSATFLQLRNKHEKDAEVLYIVSPTYAFEMQGDKLVYDDAVIVAQKWEDIDAPVVARYTKEFFEKAATDRKASLARLAALKGAKTA